MLSESQIQNVVYFLMIFKFIFLIFYTLNIYGLLFNITIFENTLKWVIILENIFVVSMGFLLLYRFSKDTIQVSQEERLLMWTLIFVLVFNGVIRIASVEWF